MRYNRAMKHKPVFLTDKHIAVRLLFAFGLFLISALAFAKVAWDVRAYETLAADVALLEWVRTFSTPWLDRVARVLTQFGGVAFVPVVTLALSGWLWAQRYRHHALLVLAGVGGASLLSLALKVFFARARPDLWEHLVFETSFAFPSGHAIASAALAASIVAALWFTRWRITAIITGTVYVIAIGFTRLYLGVHFPSDIIAGWLVAIGWIAAVSVIFLSSPLTLKRSRIDNQRDK